MVEQPAPHAPTRLPHGSCAPAAGHDRVRRDALAQQQQRVLAQWDELAAAIGQGELRRAAALAARVAAMLLAHASAEQAFLRDALAAMLAPGDARMLHVTRMRDAARSLHDALESLRTELAAAPRDSLSRLRLRRSAWQYADAYRAGVRHRERMLYPLLAGEPLASARGT